MKIDGEAIRDARKMAGMTSRQLAEAIGVSQQSVSLWETGKTSPTPKALKRLFEVFPRLAAIAYPAAPKPPVYELTDTGDACAVIRAILDSGMTPERKLELIKKVVEVKR